MTIDSTRKSPMSRARLVVLAMAMSTSTLAGCAVDEGDLHRWETTLTGPERLTAVVLHDKYPLHLRVQAAMSLIRMKPRKGQHVGLSRLIEKTLAELPSEPRAKILGELIPLMIEELKKDPPPAAGPDDARPDPSFKYKDAAYLMLTYDKVEIITDPALRKQLETALTEWAMKDFERKLSDRSQAYGMDQLLRHIGPSSVEGLPKLITKESRSIAKIADLIALIGSKETKEEASKRLVVVGEYIASPEWRKDRAPELKEANRKASLDPTQAQFDKQLEEFQNESHVRIMGSMKKVGGAAVTDYCLALAANTEQPEKRRQAALAALEGQIDRKNQKQIDLLFKIAADEKTPSIVTDQAFRRIRELPREKAAEGLYKFFSSSKWELRRLAGATVLQMSTAKNIDEFLKQLGERAHKNLNLAEFITYGAYMRDLKEGDVEKTLRPHMEDGKLPARLAAISYYYDAGTKEDLPDIAPFENDKEKIPTECEEGVECDWTCLYGEEGKKEPKDVKTVGDFVTYCIKPKMMKNVAPQPDKKKGG
jgi:hypothetical protein